MKRVSKHWSWILGLAIAAGLVYGSHFFWLPAEQSILHQGNPGSVERSTLNGIEDQKPIAVQSVLPSGKSVWKTVYLGHDGIPMRDFIDSMFRQTFGNRAMVSSGGREIGKAEERTAGILLPRLRDQNDSNSPERTAGILLPRLRDQNDSNSPDQPIDRSSDLTVTRSAEHPLLGVRPIARSSDLATAEGASGLPHWVHVVARHADGTVFYDHMWHNLRTNAGATWQEGQMAGTPGAVCTYIALTNTAITPNATDTTLSGEITSNGLARTLGTASYTAGATSYTVKNTFTATASQAAQATGLFTASSGGTMCFENTFTQVSLNSGDTLTVTWTISF